MVVYQHLDNCEHFQYMCTINKYNSIFDDNVNKYDEASTTKKELYVENIWQNIKVIDSALGWDMLLFKEASIIKRNRSILNSGMTATKEPHFKTITLF